MSDTLRIAVLVKSFTLTGGMERYVVETCRLLAARGHRLDIYAQEADPELLGDMRFCRVPARFTFSSVLSTVFFAKETAKMLQAQRYDLVHSHEKGCLQDIETIHCFSYKEGMEKYSLLRRIDQKYLNLRSALYLRLERKQMQTPWLVAVSGAIADDIQKQYGRSANVAVIPPGVDLEVFQPENIAAKREEAREAEGFPADQLVVLFVGSEFRRKGLDRLIRAIGPGMLLLVIGRGDNLSYHRRLVLQCGLEAQVRFVGLSREVFPYYAAADVVVLPSRSEAFGMSILEGMACGLPVIVSANSGVASLIRHGENGFLLHDPAEIPALLRQLLSQEERRRLGLGARALAENHSWDRVADAHEQLYRRVVSWKSQERRDNGKKFNLNNCPQ
jgi:UDP-glucose:(heptosyl)LPS alpha-1,3-glucosyltransferase